MQFKISSNMPLERKEKLKKILQKELVFKDYGLIFGTLSKVARVDDNYKLALFIKNNEIYDYRITFEPNLSNLPNANDDFKTLWTSKKSASPIHKINVKDESYTCVFVTADNKLFMQNFIKPKKVWKQSEIIEYNWEGHSYPIGLKDLIESLRRKIK